MKIPNAEHAVVDLRKLEDYCLNPEHPRGKHKAHVFASALRLTAADAAVLREELLARVQTEECEEGGSDEFGRRYVLDFSYRKGDNEAMIRSTWIIKATEDFPRLTSCFVL